MNKRTIFHHLLPWLLPLLVLFLPACGGGGGSDSSTGRLQVALTDAAPPEFSKVVLTIREVRAVPAGREGDPDGALPLVASFPTPLRVNVLELQFRQQLLGDAIVPAGDYSQLRLLLEGNDGPGAPANYVVLSGDPLQTIVPLDTPSGQSSGVKITGRFSVQEGEGTAVALDFDPARAIVQAGNSGKWNFKPNGIRVIRMDSILYTYGGLTGAALKPDASAAAGAVVSALPVGGGAPVAVTEVNPDDGSFRLFLPLGSYFLQVRAPGFTPYDSPPPAFTVVTGQDTVAGTITLQPSVP